MRQRARLGTSGIFLTARSPAGNPRDIPHRAGNPSRRLGMSCGPVHCHEWANKSPPSRPSSSITLNGDERRPRRPPIGPHGLRILCPTACGHRSRSGKRADRCRDDTGNSEPQTRWAIWSPVPVASNQLRKLKKPVGAFSKYLSTFLPSIHH